MKRKKFLVKNLLVLSLIVLMMLLLSPDIMPSAKKAEPESLDKTHKEITIAFAGDVMCHKDQLQSAFNKSTGKYEFTHNYDEIAPYIRSADFAICNLETTLGNKPFFDFPRFKSPKSIAKALKKAGYDMTVVANNHALDHGLYTQKQSIKYLRSKGFKTAGIRFKGEKRYTMVKIKGIKVAVINYTYESLRRRYRNLNTIPINYNARYAINSFKYNGKDLSISRKETKNITDTIKLAKKDGAKLVITILHWGEEYNTIPKKAQKLTAYNLAKAGSDIILGSHPHVIQPIKIIPKNTKAKIYHKVPVYYSLGNHISGMRKIPNSTGGVAYIKVTLSKKKVYDISPRVIPFWVDRYKYKKRIRYMIVPIHSMPVKSPALLTSKHFNYAKRAKRFAKKIFGEEYIIK